MTAQPLQFTITADDSSDDNFDYTIDFGDGSPMLHAEGGELLTVAHAYESAGNYTLAVTAADPGGAEGDAALRGVAISRISIQDGKLYVGGTPEDDLLLLTRDPRGGGQGVNVILNGELLGPFEFQDQILAFAGEGDDTVILGPFVPADGRLFGGPGNDTLIGGSRHDVLAGGPGSDLLFGGLGRDVLIGGEDRDWLLGSFGDDILIAGSISFNDPTAALDKIMAEWTSGRSYAERVDNLLGAGDESDSRANDDFFLRTGETVRDDDARDFVFGGFGSDLFFADRDEDRLLGFNPWREGLEELGA